MEPAVYRIRIPWLEQAKERDASARHAISNLKNSGGPFPDVWFLMFISCFFELLPLFDGQFDYQWFCHNVTSAGYNTELPESLPN
jgi:hypothetical protein